MIRYDGFVIRPQDDPDQGNIAIGVSVAIRNKSTLALVTLYADEAGTLVKTNPLTTSDTGRYSFYAPSGDYIVDVEDGSASMEISLFSADEIIEETNNAISSAISSHVSQPDPHAQYAKESDLADVATSGSYSDLISKPVLGTAAYADIGSATDDIPVVGDLATVAFSGSYNDLLNLPASGSLLQSVAKTNGDTLEWGVPNEISATGTFTMPLANAVADQVFMELYFPSADAPRVVTINRAGSDLFLRGTSTDTQYILNVSTAAGSRYITSNGTDRLVI